MKNIELLAPAGSLKKLKTALDYGADAVYAGGKDFSLRAYADNFTLDELREGVEYAHARGKKVYVTVNIFPRNSDFERAENYFKALEEIGVDAVLITDAGFISLCKKVAPNLTMHLSTQANTLNKYTVEFWGNQGVERVVLARELPLKDVKEIHEYNPSVELETFVHGAMCVSYSGRCLLSNYLDGRDANRGECVQACRWNYRMTEVGRGGDPLEIEEDGRGAYVLNSKDLNMLSYIPELIDSGVYSLKIEGRMKSEYYLATVVNAYRRAIDAVEANTFEKVRLELEEEVRKVVHRDYTTAYAFGDNAKTIAYREGQNQGTHEFIAVVLESGEGYAIVEMRNRFKKDDVLEVLSPNECFNSELIIGDMYNDKEELIDDAKIVQQKVKIITNLNLTAGDILRRKRK